MNPAVQALLDEIARAKKRAAEKKTQQAATQQTQYGILHIDGHLQLRLPPPPPKPSKEDCCQTGCTPCILDTYAEQHRAYEKTVDALTKQFEKAQKGEEAGCEFVHPHTALPGGLLDPLRFIGIPVRRTQDYGARSRLLVLEATSKEFVLSLGEHIHLRIGCRENGWITKPFTPVMIQDSDGIVRPHVFVRLYPGNPMSRFLSEVQQGTTLMVRGPVRTIENMTRALACPGPTVLVAGGSGIAPVFQILQFAQINIAYCKKQIVVVHCVSRPGDLWLQDEIGRMMPMMPGLRFHAAVSGDCGKRIDMEALGRIIGAYRTDTDAGLSQAQAVVCGPASFNDDVGGWLLQLGVPGIQKL